MSEDQEIKIGLTCSDDANNSEIPNSLEWKNGDACSYYYWEGKEWRSGIYVTFDNNHHVVRDIEDNGYTGIDCNDNIRKPETQEQREERERLEAAYDLYCHAQHSVDVIGYDCFERFRKDKVKVKFWMSIVDKTNYRLTK